MKKFVAGAWVACPHCETEFEARGHECDPPRPVTAEEIAEWRKKAIATARRLSALPYD